jgi:hypothetical protein
MRDLKHKYESQILPDLQETHQREIQHLSGVIETEKSKLTQLIERHEEESGTAQKKALEQQTLDQETTNKIKELKDGYKMLLDQNELLKYDKSELEMERDRVLSQSALEKKALNSDISHLNS